ncbi:alpha/beta hydrolase [Micromonospora sp. NPDC049374]|uniref:alpha/beta hydrolase n=1 Tax=Micromonospora sp. NPDC049374 TaxID=3154352 RepID=UPI0034135DE4
MVGREVVRLCLAAMLATGLVRPPTVPPDPAPAGFVEAYPSTAAAMESAGAPYARWAAQGRQFLAFDSHGDGRAVEVLGDLATADRIAVLVPGVGTRLADFDRGLGGVPQRAPAEQARALHAALRAADPHARVAVLAWLGYDPPDGVTTAATPAAGRRGADQLGDHLRTLAGRLPAARITVVGHSYGALVVGLAAMDAPPQVTDVVTLGGVGVGAEHADQFGPVRVWAAEAPDDWIRRVPQLRLPGLGHGVRPADDSFGARPLPAASTGHDGYLLPGGPTLAAVAEVVLCGATGTGHARPDVTVTASDGRRSGTGVAGSESRSADAISSTASPGCTWPPSGGDSDSVDTHAAGPAR